MGWEGLMISSKNSNWCTTGIILKPRSTAESPGNKQKVKRKTLHSVSNFFFIPSRTDSGRREKIDLNFYFHISFWCLKSFS